MCVVVVVVIVVVVVAVVVMYCAFVSVCVCLHREEKTSHRIMVSFEVTIEIMTITSRLTKKQKNGLDYYPLTPDVFKFEYVKPLKFKHGTTVERVKKLDHS